jgi:hypothetical protein
MESIFSALLLLLLLEEADANVFVVEHLFDCFFAPRLRTAAAEETTNDAEEEEEEAIIVVAVAVVIIMLLSFLSVARVNK